MTSFIHKFLILQFSLFVFSVSGLSKNKKLLLCSDVKYENPGSNFPEIIVFRDDDNSALCHINTKGEVSLISEENHFLFDDEYAYDRQADLLYRGNTRGIQKLKAHPKSEEDNKWVTEELLKLQMENFDKIFSVAYDWISKNMYVRTHNQVQVVSMKNTSLPAKVLFNDIAKDLPFVSLHVFPKEGYLISQRMGIITRYNLDGSNPKVLYENPEKTIKVVALDYYKNNIYWIERSDNNTERIRYVNLSGTPVQDLLHHKSLSVHKNLAVDEHYVYFSVGENNFSEVVRANKLDGKIDPNYTIENGEGKFISITVLSGQPQNIPDGHPCKESNGNCPGYCFAVPDSNGKLNKKCD